MLLLAFTSSQALAVCPASGFEDEDGNLDWDQSCFVGDASDLDWNSFAPVEWSNPSEAPYRTADALLAGWILKGLEDDQENNQDSAFAGGTKQDDNCARVRGGKAPNKDDLKRIYISSTTKENGHIILNLGWVRIPQNTTSPSAHIGFEFNQADQETAPCGGNSDGLVERTEDDMLIVYDFEGSSTDQPTISMRRWVTSGACEVGNSSPPCWGPATDLSELGFAEAQVNTTQVQLAPVDTDLAPPNSGTTSITSTLGFNEFGEAGIDLTAAGVFGDEECLAFGTAFAVSRSSGNSEQAAMKDLVGPGNINIANCGRVIIRKETVPSGSTTSFSFSTTGGLDPASFSLTGEAGDNSIQDYGVNVFAGEYTVTENTPPDGWDYTSLICGGEDSDQDLSNGSTIDNIDNDTRAVTFTLKPLDTVDCTYTNTARSALSVTKEVINACGDDDGQFTLFIDGPESGDSDKSIMTGSDGTTVSDDNLLPGTYAVGEENFTAANYTSSISGDADCSDNSVILGAGDSVSCTITNIRRPTVKIVKSVADSSIWDLLVDDGGDGFDYEAVNKVNTQSTETITITTVASGTGDSTLFGPVVLGEEAANNDANSTLDGIGTYKAYWRCDNRNGVREANDTDSFTIQQLSPGENVTCTVTNIPVAEAACTPEPDS